MDTHHAAGEAVVVHCVAGCGRTGQFVSAWCAKAGFIPRGTDPVQWLRARRKCCLETPEQIACAKRWMIGSNGARGKGLFPDKGS